jgi:phage baseplate assembly protein W
MATINRKTRQFTDINLFFTSHPATADVTKKVDEEAVKASIRNLLSTKNYERPFHPEIGCQMYSLLFENFTPITKQVIKRTIFDVISKFEPRVSVQEVKINDASDNNSISVDITFKIINSEAPITLRTAISRLR